jgi:hypothetical protein
MFYIVNMEWPNYVYRDLNLPGDYYGEIEMVVLPDNTLHVQVNSLHQNYTMDYLIDCPAGQADVVVKYHENDAIVGNDAKLNNEIDQEDVIAFLVSFGYDGWISSQDRADNNTEVCLFLPSEMTTLIWRNIYGP